MMKAPRHPTTLYKDDLAEIVREIQFLLFYEEGEDGRDAWTLGKSIDYVDFINSVTQALENYDLLPKKLKGPKDWHPGK